MYCKNCGTFKKGSLARGSTCCGNQKLMQELTQQLSEGLRRCKNCKSIKLRKELVQPFDQTGWYICETCLMAGPLWMIAGYEWEGGDMRQRLIG